MVGYTTFFNVDTIYCNTVTFNYWQGTKRVDSRFMTYLTQEIRKGVNNTVTNLNKVKSAAVSKAKGHARPEMTFVDYSADWDGHRFREESVEEPDFYNRQNTWFFYVPDESFFWDAFNDLKPGTNPAADTSTCRDTSKASGD